MHAGLLRLLIGVAVSGSPLAAQATDWDKFVDLATERHGEFGHRAAAFLAEHAPPRDRELSTGFLFEHLDLAMQARRQFEWAGTVEADLFMNDVLPYAVVDETRESWRPLLFAVATELVANCETAADAAQSLNARLFDRLAVHYDTGRKAPNQSPSESMAQSRATCTGLSILLIDACRAVGIPARLAGVASWHDKRGNHSWVEVHDGERWRFLGADEFDAAGLDRGWFVGDARRAVAGDRRFAVWATSWSPAGGSDDWFPMVWSPDDHSVPAIEVTARYAPPAPVPATSNKARHSYTLVRTAGGPRITGELTLLGPNGELLAEDRTRSGRADLNDMPTFAVPVLTRCRLKVRVGTDERSMDVWTMEPGAETSEIRWDQLELGEAEAEVLVARVFAEQRTQWIEDTEDEVEEKTIRVGERSLRLLERTFGEPGASGHSLWISMHGGGGAPTRVNDQQWRNQIRLYQLEEGIYVAPRAPTDTWNLWHEAHIDDLFDRLIATYVATRGVDPDRVYLLGYSAGGDGVYQLAPRMADRFAAASMMAGHPNDASPLGLRNLPFAIFVGGEDGAYNRNQVAVDYGERLDALGEADPDGYPHRVTVYDGLGHWMDGRDAEALPWMAEQTRNAWPGRVVWRQAGRLHDRFYWLAVDEDQRQGGSVLRAEVDGQTIRIEAEGVTACRLRLRDRLLDLDQDLKVVVGERTVFEGRVMRTEKAIRRSLEQRLDPASAATAELRIEW